MVGLVALEGLLGISCPFYPLYPYNTEYLLRARVYVPAIPTFPGLVLRTFCVRVRACVGHRVHYVHVWAHVLCVCLCVSVYV